MTTLQETSVPTDESTPSDDVVVTFEPVVTFDPTEAQDPTLEPSTAGSTLSPTSGGTFEETFLPTGNADFIVSEPEQEPSESESEPESQPEAESETQSEDDNDHPLDCEIDCVAWVYDNCIGKNPNEPHCIVKPLVNLNFIDRDLSSLSSDEIYKGVLNSVHDE